MSASHYHICRLFYVIRQKNIEVVDDYIVALYVIFEMITKRKWLQNLQTMAEETVRRRFIVLSYDIIKWLSEEKVIDNPKLSMTAANRRALRWEIKSTQSKLNTCSISKNAVYLEEVQIKYMQR